MFVEKEKKMQALIIKEVATYFKTETKQSRSRQVKLEISTKEVTFT
jgi:hypothetical protein